MRIDCFLFPSNAPCSFQKYFSIVYHVQSTVLVTVEETKGGKTSSVFIQDGDGQCVWELVVGAPIEETAEWEGMEKVRMRN